MATAFRRLSKPHPRLLYKGDRMRRDEFHRMYCEMLEDYRAELMKCSPSHASGQTSWAILAPTSRCASCNSYSC